MPRGRSPAARPSTRSASALAARSSRARSPWSRRAASAPSRASRCSRRCSTSRTRATSASTCRARSLAAREPALMAGQRIHGAELAAAFASLRANDLVWNYVVSNYLKGETPPAFDLLYWNGDSANLPGPMFVYLPQEFLSRQQAARWRRADDGRRADRSRARRRCPRTSSPRATITSCRGARRIGRRSSWAARSRSSWARPDTSPGVVNPPAKHRRNYWTNSRAAGIGRRMARGGDVASRKLVAALGRVARARTAGRGIPRRMRSAAHAIPPSNRRRATTSSKRPDEAARRTTAPRTRDLLTDKR